MEMCGENQQEVKNSGIYRITCVANNHFYYGSSINLKNRFRDHISKLRSQSHRNQRLQRIFNKYGEASLTFEVVQYCDPSFVLISEQEYLDEYHKNSNCINFCRDAKSPMAGLKFSEDHKRKIAEAQARNKYTFYYKCGKIESFNSLSLAGKRFKVKPAIVSKWFKRRDLGRNHGILQTSDIIKAEKSGDEEIVLLPYQHKTEPWILAGATSKTEYYRELRKNK